MSTSQVNPTTSLNPSATEFVPSNFTVPSRSGAAAAPAGGAGHAGNAYGNNGRYQNNQHHHYNNNNNYNNRSYNNNYSNGGHNNRNNQNYRNNNNNSMYYNGNHNGGYFNQNDVDPIEIEARCEAVIEILQDDQIRDHLNPVSRFPNSEPAVSSYQDEAKDFDGQCDDEEELMEMMAMQEECRLEMMKFYIQSQNPGLFEEIYHDVSYPDAVKAKQQHQAAQPPAAEDDPLVPLANLTLSDAPCASGDEQPSVDAEPALTTITTSTSVNTNGTSIKDLILNELNPNAYEFVPNKFAEEAEETN